MKTFLLYRDRDVDWEQPLPANADDLAADLGLAALIQAMAAGDKIIAPIATKVVLWSLADVNSILYRQAVLRDCLAQRDIVRDIYKLAGEAIENESRNFWGIRTRQAGSILRRARDVLLMFFEILRKLRGIADEHGSFFESEGFSRFFAMLRNELDDAYLNEVYRQLRAVEFRGGMLMTARLGQGNHGSEYVLRDFDRPPQNWFTRLFAPREPGFTFELHPRDESGARALSELGDRGVNLVADALAQSADHILAFFNALRDELAFYVGCINLHEQLNAKEEPLCFPVPQAVDARIYRVCGLYDPSLALSMPQRVVGNEAYATGKLMIIITGANQGGKSTFLRSVGTAQLMMACGMFVPADTFNASLCNGLFTHYKREEDAEMESGKFDEELRRMNGLAGHLSLGTLLLFNESFAATNDREGSEIARQIVEALVDSGVRVAFVTHLYEFAHRVWTERPGEALFLRADRSEDGQRTFRLREGEPLPTSYGEDVYRRVFGAELARSGPQPHA
jgi:DNA mismatch repair ATPase MutS